MREQVTGLDTLTSVFAWAQFQGPQALLIALRPPPPLPPFPAFKSFFSVYGGLCDVKPEVGPHFQEE